MDRVYEKLILRRTMGSSLTTCNNAIPKTLSGRLVSAPHRTVSAKFCVLVAEEMATFRVWTEVFQHARERAGPV